VRLYTRNGHDFGKPFPLIVASVATLPPRSCLIDGEAIVSDDSGLAVFELLRSWPTTLSAVLCAFDLLEPLGSIRELVWGRISADANAKAISSTERRRKAARLHTPCQPVQSGNRTTN